MKELRDTHKQDVKTQSNLMKSIERLTNQVADLTTQNKTLQQKVNDLLLQISVGNKVRFGSASQKGTKKKAAPVQDREKDKDDFDGTNGTAMSSNQQTDAAPAEESESTDQTRKSFEYRKGMKYQTMFADNRIVHESDVNLLPEGATVIVIYHTFIDTCKMCGVSTLEYFKEFFNSAIKREQFRMYSRTVEREQIRLQIKAIMQGRTDYENMLPMTIKLP